MALQQVLTPPVTGARIIPKPDWLHHLERWLGAALPLHPHLLSGLKVLTALPIVLALGQVGPLTADPRIILPLFAIFALLDYLDGVIAREHRRETAFGRVFDRLTDLPLLIPAALLCCATLPAAPVLAKLGLDLVLLAVFLSGRGPVENRIRTVMSTGVLLIMIVASQGWLPALVTPRLAVALLWVNVAFSSLIVLVRLRPFRKRFIATALSGANLLCGAGSIAAAILGRLELCLALLAAGALFDGLDGAAARKWGSTRWGAYADDVADGVNYGLAPGAVLICTLGGMEGWILGVAFALFTLGRLFYFTLRQGESDPRWFDGLPSTAGALLVICGALLFEDHPALLGVMVGAACTLMVLFEARFKHLGRWLSRHPRLVALLPLCAVGLPLAGLLWGVEVPAALMLGAALIYGFFTPLSMLIMEWMRPRRPESRKPSRSAIL